MKSKLLLSLSFVAVAFTPTFAETSASNYLFWNMVLDESGLSRWNWRQNSLLTEDRKTETLNYNAEFYAEKHFSATLRSSARRIGVSGGPFKDVVAFQNPDGSKVLAFANGTDQASSVVLQVGESPVQLDVPAKSINTVILR
jgi:glucosylceramidase